MTQRYARIHFPFSAIVGMENAKLALMVNAVNPLIGGVVLAGDKGTGKSTLVRAFAQVLPEQPVAKGCPFNCNPFNPLEMCDYHYELWARGEKIEYEFRKIRVIDLPLNATPDRVVGSIDIEQTIKTGKVVFKPGLLAEANRNILYIDEVNLLEDYIADLILDAAASGWNVVEREGVSFKHPARFVLVGSMNPEEGMLRPQILDRFGLYVPVEASMSPEERAEIVGRVEEFARDPVAFYKKWEPMEKQIEERIAKAREIINNVTIDKDLLRLITETIIKLGIKTHRAEIVTVRTAKAIAALDGRVRVNLNDVTKAMELALRHRLRSKPFEEPQKRLEDIIKELTGEKPEQKEGQGNKGETQGGGTPETMGPVSPPSKPPRRGGTPGTTGSGESDVVKTFLRNLSETPVSLPKEPYIDVDAWGSLFSRGSRGFKTVAIASLKGVAIDAIPPVRQELVDVDLPASLRACAALNPTYPIAIRPSCIRVRVRKERVPALHVILLDTSGSMLVRKRISTAKYILKTLMEEAYIRRTFVSIIAFRGVDAITVAEPTRNLEIAFKSLEGIPVGGSTPFTAALLKALDYFRTFKKVFKEPRLILHIISDGGANVFLTRDFKNELLELAEEYRRLGVEVVMYHTGSGTRIIKPNYMKLFVEATKGKYYEV